jgi:hypothetical protein
MITRESLLFIRTIREDDGSGMRFLGQEEGDGLRFFGHWKTHFPHSLHGLSAVLQAWPEQGIEASLVRWDGENYPVFTLEVAILRWPSADEWPVLLEKTLKWFTDQGAIVAWCGDELSTASIDNFDPILARGNVYACYFDGRFILNSNLDEEYRILTDEQLLAVQSHLGQATPG